MECRHYEQCEAPLCPMQELSLEHGIFFPNEQICRRRKYANLDWVKKQKLIAKRHGSPYHFFNLKMLNAIRQIRHGIQGADPDKPMSARPDERWIQEHIRPAEKLVGSKKLAES